MLTPTEIGTLVSLLSDAIEDHSWEEGEEEAAGEYLLELQLQAIRDKLEAALPQPKTWALHVCSIRFPGQAHSKYVLVRASRKEGHEVATALEIAMKAFPSASEGLYLRAANPAQIADASRPENLTKDIMEI